MTLKWQDYVEERKDVMVGKPVFKGTRLTVEFILKQMGAGMTHEALLDQYPTLKPEHLLRRHALRGRRRVDGSIHLSVTRRTYEAARGVIAFEERVHQALGPVMRRR